MFCHTEVRTYNTIIDAHILASSLDVGSSEPLHFCHISHVSTHSISNVSTHSSPSTCVHAFNRTACCPTLHVHEPTADSRQPGFPWPCHLQHFFTVHGCQDVNGSCRPGVCEWHLHDRMGPSPAGNRTLSHPCIHCCGQGAVPHHNLCRWTRKRWASTAGGRCAPVAIKSC